MNRIVFILCAFNGIAQAANPVFPKTPKPPVAVTVYLINIMPFAVTLSYAIKSPANSTIQGPNIIQPTQMIPIIQFNIPDNFNSSGPYEFITAVKGSIPESCTPFSVFISQRLDIANGTSTIQYSIASSNPILNNEWLTPDKYQSRKITIEQTDIYFDYIARRTENSIQVYYSIAPKQIALNSNTVQTIIGSNFEKIDQLAPRVWKEMFSPSSSALKPLDAWIPARPEIRYDQTAFLGSHASYANAQEGFLYTKQLWSIKEQLDKGVRVLQLSIYPDGDNPPKLGLDDCSTSQFLRTGPQISALETLKIIKKWLDENNNEVLTLMLRTKLTADETLKLIDQSGLTPLALTKKIWDPVNHTGAWPRIGWMQLYKQRLVIFDHSENINPDQYGYSAKQFLVQNTPGSLDIAKAAERSSPSIKPIPRLFQCNYYGSIASPLPLHNTPEQIKKLLEEIRSKKYLEPNQTPNFIMIDHIEMGNPMALINEINKAAQSQ